MSTNTARAGSELCQACGLCCTGLLSTHVGVAPKDEYVYLHPDVDLKVKRPNKRAMALPCQFLRGTQCSIYNDRPQKCRDFTCNLHHVVVNRSQKFEDALSIIEHLKSLIREVDPLLLELTGKPFKTLNFRNFCRDFYTDVKQRMSKGQALSNTEQQFIPLAFEISKIIDRHLMSTSRVTEFASLMVAEDQWDGSDTV